jgi:Xaa-Pro aminopeptidase
MNYLARRQRLAGQLQPLGLDALLVTNPVNITYLTGFTGEASYLVVGRYQILLISDRRFTEQIAEECPGLDVHFRPPTTTTVPETAKVLASFGAHKVGFEAGHLTVENFVRLRESVNAVDWAPTRRVVETMRIVKDDDEVQQIRAAIAVAERAYAMFRAMLHPDASERELCDAMEMYVRRAGGTGTSFPTIAAVGPRSALAHAPPTDAVVRSADWLLLDWGAAGTYYKSDLTRLLATRRSWFRPRSGQPPADDAKFAKVYAAVLAAQERAIAALRPGVPARDVDAAARSALAEAGLEEYFTHGLGHGLGLQVHEAPDLRASSDEELQAGMVVTIEPGVYIAGWGGIRIEDDLLVTPDGSDRLSTLPRDLAAADVL